MSQYDSTLPTRAGQAMLIEMLSTSKALHFTKVALGDGVKKENQANETMTALISEKLIGEMVKKTPQRDGSVKLEVKISNDGLQEGFFSRELGVWGKVGEDGEEQLILYTYATNASYIPSSEQLDEKIIRVFIAVGGATNIKIEVPRHGVVTVDMLEDHNDDVNAHGGAISKGISEHNEDKNAHAEMLKKHNADKNAHKPILDAINAITGTDAFNKAPSKSIVEIINLLGMGGIVAAKLDANAGFVKHANGYTAMWGELNVKPSNYYSEDNSLESLVYVNYPVRVNTIHYAGANCLGDVLSVTDEYARIVQATNTQARISVRVTKSSQGIGNLLVKWHVIAS